MSPVFFERAWLLMMALSLALLILGWRGRRIHDRPTCRKCRFDLTGLREGGAPPLAERCPECGAPLSARRAVRRGDRRKRWGLVVAGPALASLATAWLVALVVGNVRGHNWTHYKPTALLIRETASANDFVVHAALQQLTSRLTAGRLKERHVRAMNVAALAAQASESTEAPWPWSHWMDAAVALGTLSEEQARAFEQNAWSPRLTTPPRVRCGAAMNVLPILYARAESCRGAWVRETRVWIQSPDGRTSSRATIRNNELIRNRAGAGRTLVAPSLPGKHTVCATFVLDVVDIRRPYVVLNRREISISAPFEALARDDRPVRLIPNESLADAVRSSIAYVNASARVERGALMLTITSDFRKPPVNLAFSVVARQGDREWPIGSVSAPVAAPFSSTCARVAPTPGLRPGTIDLVFRATEAALRDTVDLDEHAWDGTIIVEGVPVDWKPFAPPAPRAP